MDSNKNAADSFKACITEAASTSVAPIQVGETSFTLASFQGVSLWTELRIQIIASLSCMDHCATVKIKRRVGVGEITIESSLGLCAPFFLFYGIKNAAEKWRAEHQKQNPEEWRTCLSIKEDVPLFDTIANDLQDFGDYIVSAVKRVTPDVQFVSHFAATETAPDGKIVWSCLKARLRYKQSYVFDIDIVRDCKLLCGSEVALSYNPILYAWYGQTEPGRSIFRTALRSAYEWKRAHEKKKADTWIGFVEKREWIIKPNPISDKNEEALDGLCAAVYDAGMDIQMFARNIILKDDEWVLLEVSFCTFDQTKYYVTVERRNSTEKASFGVYKYLWTRQMVSNEFNTPLKSVQNAVSEWVLSQKINIKTENTL